MLTPWIEVELPFRLRTTPEMAVLQQKFIASVQAAKDAFREAEPLLSRWELTDVEAIADVLAVQDKYPWLREHLTAPDVEKWFAQAGIRIQNDVPDNLKQSFVAVVQHRYAYKKMSKFVDTFPGVLQAQEDIAALTEKERAMQFCNHPACAVGVLIDVRSSTEGGTSHTIMLIGDVTPTGLDDGCCSAGLQDDDVIVRYRDMRPILSEAVNG